MCTHIEVRVCAHEGNCVCVRTCTCVHPPAHGDQKQPAGVGALLLGGF